MGRRVGAWLLDGFVASFLIFVPVILVIATGAVSLNQQALDQIRSIEPASHQPFVNVTAPFLNVNTGFLMLAAAVYVALHFAYYAGSWATFGGTPCQRGLNLLVVDFESGRNLSIGRACLRWALLGGISAAANALFLVYVFTLLATTPANELLGTGYYGSFTLPAPFVTLSSLSNLISWGGSLWLIAPIVSVGMHPLRRGLHDRLVGSIVWGPLPTAPSWPTYPGWPTYLYPPQAPYWPPQGGPGFSYPPQAWSGYPPQPPFWAGASYPPPAGDQPPTADGPPACPSGPGDAQGPWPPATIPFPFGYQAPQWIAAPAPPGPAPGLAWGGIAVRAGALVLDSIFFLVFGMVISWIMYLPGLRTVDGTIQYQTLANVIDVVTSLVVLFYVPAWWYLFGGTPGQRLLGLRIVRASDGGSLGIGRILLRYLVWTFCLCALCIPALIAAIIASNDPQKRAWTDHAGDSVVLRTL